MRRESVCERVRERERHLHCVWRVCGLKSQRISSDLEVQGKISRCLLSFLKPTKQTKKIIGATERGKRRKWKKRVTLLERFFFRFLSLLGVSKQQNPNKWDQNIRMKMKEKPLTGGGERCWSMRRSKIRRSIFVRESRRGDDGDVGEVGDIELKRK